MVDVKEEYVAMAVTADGYDPKEVFVLAPDPDLDEGALLALPLESDDVTEVLSTFGWDVVGKWLTTIYGSVAVVRPQEVSA